MIKSNLLRWKKDARVWMTAILILCLFLRYFSGLTRFGLEHGTKITPCLLPIVFTDSNVSNGLCKVLVTLGMISIFADAPFMDDQTPYLLIRTRRKSWWIGECGYLWAASFIYLLYLTLVSILVVLPTVSFTDLWGGTLRYMTNPSTTDITKYEYLRSLLLPDTVIHVLYPSAAQLFSFTAAWLSYVFLGHLIYFVNLRTRQKVWGVLAAVFFVMLDPIAVYFGRDWLVAISPMTWISIEFWSILGYGHPLSPYAVYGTFAILIALMTVLIGVSSRRIPIETMSD